MTEARVQRRLAAILMTDLKAAKPPLDYLG